ncbi:MAG: protein kinase [Planctomycetia bacterium]|nr:protein kinase [Planctomycetia bacterium]
MQPAPQAAAELQPGAEPIAGYRLVQRLGAGGFGEVWKAQAPGGFDIALKFVNVAAQGKAGKRQAGDTELRALEIIKNIHHPNLLTTFGAWQTPQYLIIAMELADGSLWDRFCQYQEQDQPGIPRAELLDYFEEAAKGIDYLNSAKLQLPDGEAIGVQHRDIKPQNILLAGGGVKVADFGLARLLERSLTGHTGSMTVSYAAPEFFQGQTSRQSDQYSLAVSYCQMRGGRLPFEGNMAQVTAGHLMREPDLTMLPEPERPIISGALAKNPAERWPSCRELVQALRAVKLPGEGGSKTFSLPPSSSSPGIGPTVHPTELTVAVEKPQAGGKGKTLVVLFITLLAAGGLIAWKWAKSNDYFQRPMQGVSLGAPTELQIRAGESQTLNVQVRRDNYSGPVQLRGDRVPEGVTVQETTIPAGVGEAGVTILVGKQLPESVHELTLLLISDAGQQPVAFRLTVLPSLAVMHLRNGDRHLARREFDEAVREYDETLKREPDLYEARLHRGQALTQRGDFTAAAHDFTEAIRLNPQAGEPYRDRAHVRNQQRQFEQAIADASQAIKLNGRDALAYAHRSWSYLGLKDAERAIADGYESIRLDPKDARPFAARGLAYLQRGNLDSALNDLNKAIELNPTYRAAYEGRASVYDKKGDAAKATADRKRAAALK